MTSESVNPSPDARVRVDAYLDAIERVLVAADMPRAERKGIADDVEAQILEMLTARGCAKPSVEDVEAVLSDLDPPEAYAEAGGAPPGAPATASPSAPPRRSDRPHFSRAAIVGACWAPLALAMIPLMLLVLWPMLSYMDARLHTPGEPVMHVVPQGAAPTEEKSENATVSATDAEQEAAERRALEVQHEAAQRRLEAEMKRKAAAARAEARVERHVQLSWLAILILGPLGLLGLSAPFGTTILGIVAISRIRRSAGRIYGMGLALFDALLFPLIVLDGLIVLCAALVGTGVAGSPVWVMVVGLVLAVVADVVIVRLLRRRVGAPAGDAR